MSLQSSQFWEGEAICPFHAKNKTKAPFPVPMAIGKGKVDHPASAG